MKTVFTILLGIITILTIVNTVRMKRMASKMKMKVHDIEKNNFQLMEIINELRESPTDQVNENSSKE